MIIQKMYLMYCEVKNKEASNSMMFLTILSDNIKANKKNNTLEGYRNKDKNNQPLLKNINIPYDIN